MASQCETKNSTLLSEFVRLAKKSQMDGLNTVVCQVNERDQSFWTTESVTMGPKPYLNRIKHLPKYTSNSKGYTK